MPGPENRHMTTQLLWLWINKKTECKKRGFFLIICLYCDKIKTVFLQMSAGGRENLWHTGK